MILTHLVMFKFFAGAGGAGGAGTLRQTFLGIPIGIRI